MSAPASQVMPLPALRPSASSASAAASPALSGRQELESQPIHEAMHGFTQVIGTLPFALPNVRTGHEREDLSKVINPAEDSDVARMCCAALCCFTGIGACYVCCKTNLIEEGAYGFSMNNGRPEIFFPGWQVLLSPLNSFSSKSKAEADVIRTGPVTIVRINEGELGFAMDAGQPQLLLPGVHARKNATFIFERSVSVERELIVYGPIKLVIVKTGLARVAYSRGRAIILTEGRYAINDGTITVPEDSSVDITQQNMRFSGHNVLLDGGISLLVEGLLTYQVVDVERLIKELGNRNLERALSDVTKAELARVFAAVHLEQISTAQMEAPLLPRVDPSLLSPAADSSVLGEKGEHSTQVPGEAEGQSRSKICHSIIEHVTPIAKAWGVRIINFQLESTKIADQSYAKEYEVASLGIAKSKANLRSVEAENEILLQRSVAQATAQKIRAEGLASAVVIGAQSAARARKIEAQARNEAATQMSNDFARKLALANQQVDFAGALKASVLTVVPDSNVGSPIVNQIATAASFQPQNAGGR